MFKNLSALFVAIGLFAFTGCQKDANISQYAKSADTAKILGGEVVQPNDIVANSTVALKYIQGNQAYPMCTGTLISPNLVLTAAHCLRNTAKEQVRIGFSIEVKNQLDNETMIEVENFISHPAYFGRSNDVALIRLAKPAPAPYQPVGVLSAAYKLQVGMPMLLAGYGVIDDATGADTEALRKVTVPMAKILETIVVTDQTKVSGACNGDSGGPAYLEKDGVLYVYGITRGPHDGAPDCHHYGEYTYASKFEQFILDSAKALGADLPSFTVPAGTQLEDPVAADDQAQASVTAN